MMRVIILDNGLGMSTPGHHEHMARNLIADSYREGFETHLLVHRHADPSRITGMAAKKVFMDPFYHSIGADPLKAYGRVERYLTSFASTGLMVSKNDLLIVPTASIIELFALSYWALLKDQGLNFAFLFHNLEFPAMKDPLRSYMWAEAVDQINRLGKDRFWLGTTNNVLSSMLEAASGYRFRIFPSVMWVGDKTVRPRRLEHQPRVGFLGGLRVHKGSDRIKNLVRLMKQEHPSWKIVVQIGDEPEAHELFELANEPSVELITETLDDVALATAIRSLDALVCPYDRQFYHHAGSGLQQIASALGVPVVVPSNTVMASELLGPAKPLGCIYNGNRDEDVIVAVSALISGRLASQSQSVTAAERWRAHASGEAMSHDLLGWAKARAFSQKSPRQDLSYGNVLRQPPFN